MSVASGFRRIVSVRIDEPTEPNERFCPDWMELWKIAVETGNTALELQVKEALRFQGIMGTSLNLYACRAYHFDAVVAEIERQHREVTAPFGAGV